MDEETLQKLKTMLGVPVEKVEEGEGEITVYIPKDQIARAIGSSGSVVRSAELVLGKKLVLKEA